MQLEACGTHTPRLYSTMAGTSTAATCHCGQVKLVVPAAPASVTSCNCTVCHAYGALWAYYQDADVALPAEGLTQAYCHGNRTTAFHRCSTCGCVTHFVGIERGPAGSLKGLMAINARLMERSVLQSLNVKRFDGLESWAVLDTDFKWGYCPTSDVVTTKPRAGM